MKEFISQALWHVRQLIKPECDLNVFSAEALLEAALAAPPEGLCENCKKDPNVGHTLDDVYLCKNCGADLKWRLND